MKRSSRVQIEQLENVALKKVLLKVSAIPKGKVTTYKELAKALSTKAYRHIGSLLGKNPYLVAIPCHRVVCSSGAVGGYANGIPKKINLLRKEGILIKNNRVENMPLYFFKLTKK